VRALERGGFVHVSTRGSHAKLRHLEFGRVVIVPLHRTLAVGTIASILRQAGLSAEDFRAAVAFSTVSTRLVRVGASRHTIGWPRRARRRPTRPADRIRQAAELHDIGKVAIPDEILRKPGPLDPAEWAFIRHGPRIGERITAAAPALAPVAGLIRSSRERFDGSGYPDQLRAQDIPLGARIIAACDAFVAMTSPRPYAPSRNQDDAIAELRRAAGTQLDPQVVAALIDTLVHASTATAEART
jgi:predicted RNA binding protein YcfA (HicA-like mRNA interferase family)